MASESTTGPSWPGPGAGAGRPEQAWKPPGKHERRGSAVSAGWCQTASDGSPWPRATSAWLLGTSGTRPSWLGPKRRSLAGSARLLPSDLFRCCSAMPSTVCGVAGEAIIAAADFESGAASSWLSPERAKPPSSPKRTSALCRWSGDALAAAIRRAGDGSPMPSKWPASSSKIATAARARAARLRRGAPARIAGEVRRDAQPRRERARGPRPSERSPRRGAQSDEPLAPQAAIARALDALDSRRASTLARQHREDSGRRPVRRGQPAASFDSSATPASMRWQNHDTSGTVS